MLSFRQEIDKLFGLPRAGVLPRRERKGTGDNDHE
jgi:hypothetical protein